MMIPSTPAAKQSSRHFADFVCHLNARRYRDALLAVEQCWLVERDPFHQGLVQLCCALNQMLLGQTTGPKFLLARAKLRLMPYAPRHGGLNVARILVFIQECESIVRDDGARVEPPKLRLRRLPGKSKGSGNIARRRR